MQFTEPVTMLTDYAIAVETIIFAVLLIRVKNVKKKTAIYFWAAAFMTIAIATILGGTYHGFQLYFKEATKIILWKAVVYSLSISSFFMILGTVVSAVPSWLHKLFLIIISFKSILYIHLTAHKNNFYYVIVDYLSAMSRILILQIYIFYRYQKPSALWIIMGIIISFIAAGVQQSGWIFANNFNHNDLSHIISLIAFYLLYRGSRLLRSW